LNLVERNFGPKSATESQKNEILFYRTGYMPEEDRGAEA
jgi:hypothetical protein